MVDTEAPKVWVLKLCIKVRLEEQVVSYMFEEMERCAGLFVSHLRDSSNSNVWVTVVLVTLKIEYLTMWVSLGCETFQGNSTGNIFQ